jgi:site-specific recombinase XerD
MLDADFEQLLADTLAVHGRSPRTQDTYVLMLRLFGRYLDQRQTGKTVGTAGPEDVAAHQRHLATERRASFSSFNQTTCALRFFYRHCLERPDFEFPACRTARAGPSRRSSRPGRWWPSSTPAATSSTRPCS